MYRFFDRSRENLARGAGRDYSRDSLGLRDGSEMVVSDVCVKGKQTLYFILMVLISFILRLFSLCVLFCDLLFCKFKVLFFSVKFCDIFSYYVSGKAHNCPTIWFS